MKSSFFAALSAKVAEEQSSKTVLNKDGTLKADALREVLANGMVLGLVNKVRVETPAPAEDAILRQARTEARFGKSHLAKNLKQALASPEGALAEAMLSVFTRLHDLWSNGVEAAYESKRRNFEYLFSNYQPQEVAEGLCEAVLMDENGSAKFQVVAGRLGKKLGDGVRGYTLASSLLAMCEGPLYAVSKGRKGGYRVDRKVSLRPAFYQWRAESQYELPLTCAPARVSRKSNTAGYWDPDTRLPLVLGRYTQHSQALSTDVLNILNQTSWSLDEDVLESRQDDKPRKAVREVNDIFRVEYPDGDQAWRRYRERTYEAGKLMIKSGNRFWFTHQYDSRGRVYPHAYLLSLNSSKWRRHMLNFSVGRKLTEEGKREVKLAIAGAYGLTGTDQEKLDWFEQASQDWLAHVVKAKDQLLFKKLVSHWEEAKSNPDYLWNAPLGLDAHASGIQILSVVSGDLNGCRMTNLIDKEVFYDLYTSMAEAMERITGVAISDRDDIKLAVMTAFYGSKALPFEIYGENEKYFWELLEKELPGAYSSFERIQSAWRSDVSHHQWTMPDGHFVSVPVRETEEVTVEVDELGHAKLNFEISVCKPQKTGVALAANVTHSMDAYLLRETVRRFYMLGGRQIGTVHDCFYVHPNDAGKVREAYREALVSIAETDLLGFILTQIEGDGITRTDKIDKDLPDLIRQGRYAIA